MYEPPPAAVGRGGRLIPNRSHGHEFIACQARAAGLDFTKDGNCFTAVAAPTGLARVADTLSQPATTGRLSQVGNRWIHTACRVARIGAKRPRIRRVPRGSTVPPPCRRGGYRGSGSRRSGGTVTVTPNSAATYPANSCLVGRHPS